MNICTIFQMMNLLISTHVDTPANHAQLLKGLQWTQEQCQVEQKKEVKADKKGKPDSNQK